MLHKKDPDAAVVRRLLSEDLPPKFDYLERSLDGDYFVGGRVSVADITLASDLTISITSAFRSTRRAIRICWRTSNVC